MKKGFTFAVLAVMATLIAGFVFGLKKPSTHDVPIASGPPSSEENVLREAIQVPTEGGADAADTVEVRPVLGSKIELKRGKLAWEERIENTLNSEELSEPAKARQLFTMLPALPEHGLTTAAEEAVKRVPDSEYNTVALPLMINPQTHGLVQSVLFADLMERPDVVTMPALLRIAQIPNHPYARFALDNLNLLLDRDFGSDWPKWDAEIRRSLATGK